jgi:hypothetical protein
MCLPTARETGKRGGMVKRDRVASPNRLVIQGAEAIVAAYLIPPRAPHHSSGQRASRGLVKGRETARRFKPIHRNGPEK